MASRIRSLLCRYGLHWDTYLDSALYTSAERCNDCQAWVDPIRGENVDRERRLHDIWNKQSRKTTD